MKLHIPANTPVRKMNRHWQFCVGGCHAKMVLRTDYVRQLKFVHDTLGIEYIRFHGLFNDDMDTMASLADIMPFPGAEKFSERNFHKIGVVFDNILEIGMKPFVELGFMPKRLASGEEQCAFFYRGNITPPKDYDAWEDYIRSFIRFLQHRYGEEEIRTWFFEVWNEPDLQHIFFSGSQQDYFELYAHTARAVKSVDPKLRVGGPATSGSKWVAAFVRYCQENAVPVDFVTTHQYAGDPLGGVEDQGGPDVQEGFAAAGSTDGMQSMISGLMARLQNAGDTSFLGGIRAFIPDKSELEDIPNDLFRKNAAIVKEQAQGLPVYYTEWNENATFSAYTNDTRKTASYIVKAALDVEQSVTASSIWCFSDLFEEFHVFQQQFHGGFGMLTLDGIPKPSYYAVKLLNQTGEDRLQLPENATDGEISAAAFRGNGGTQLLLFRQKMKNLDLPKEEAEISIELPAAPGRVTVQKIDEENGNPLAYWKAMGEPLEMNRAELQALAENSTMPETELPYIYENGVLVLRAALGVNDVWLIKIEE